MRLNNKARLKNTLKKLNALPIDRSQPEHRLDASQDALDFLALLAGQKPVCLIGRGFDDPQWIKGVLQIAVDLKLHVIDGPYWDASLEHDDLPAWYVAHVRDGLSRLRAYYIARARDVADDVLQACETGRPTPEIEARLLAYPVCCVAAHYQRNRIYHAGWLRILERKSSGETAEMQRLLSAGELLQPETEAERAAFIAAMDVSPAPYTSVNMCESCRASPESPAMVMSRRYGELAAAVDPDFAATLGVTNL